jgi:hypothetical protein
MFHPERRISFSEFMYHSIQTTRFFGAEPKVLREIEGHLRMTDKSGLLHSDESGD